MTEKQARFCELAIKRFNREREPETIEIERQTWDGRTLGYCITIEAGGSTLIGIATGVAHNLIYSLLMACGEWDGELSLTNPSILKSQRDGNGDADALLWVAMREMLAEYEGLGEAS